MKYTSKAANNKAVKLAQIKTDYEPGVNMLAVSTNQTDFEYDIHSLVKAFYPDQEVKVFLGTDSGGETCSSDDNLPDIHITFDEGKILLLVIGISDCHDDSYQALGVEIDASMSRIAIKNALKKLIYHGLSRHTGKLLPWGALTGIRPVKIPMKLLEQGVPEVDIMQHLKSIYLVSDEKARLALDIAVREREILTAADYPSGYSLYIGIPFCPTTCLYCSFTSYSIAGWKDRIDDYLDALEKEINYVSESYAGRRLDTIYVGGGTPTTLSPGQLERLLKTVGTKFDLTVLQEYTLEAGRADSITEEKLAVLKHYGVSRISINPQTMNQETLKRIGRQHTVDQVQEAFTLARKMGFDNINMDIILGLPDESSADVIRTLDAIRLLRPDSLTIHSLAVKRASNLSRWIQEHGMDSMINTEETMEIAMSGAKSMGMQPYYLYRQKNMAGNFENTGYALPGHYGLYNILMMEEIQTVIALGAGTVSKRVYADGRIERRDNIKDAGLYIERVTEMIDRKKQLFAIPEY